MATGTLGKGLETLVNNSAKTLGTAQVGLNKVLWGNGNTQPIISANFSKDTGKIQYTSTTPITTTPSKANILNSGVIHALDVLNEVNLCEVLTYLTVPINQKKKPRPPKGSWSTQQTIFYTLQDECTLVIHYIDTFEAHQTTLINSFANFAANVIAPGSGYSGSFLNTPQQSNNNTTATNPNTNAYVTQEQWQAQAPAQEKARKQTQVAAQAKARQTAADEQGAPPVDGSVTQQQAANQQGGVDVTNPNAAAASKSTGTGGSTDIQGTDVLKYNMYFLIRTISNTFTAGTGPGNLFTPEDRQLLKLVPGIGNSLNIIDNFSLGADGITNYTNISSPELERLKQQIALLRTACTTITNLNLTNAIATAVTFLPNDIRNQIEQIRKFLDPTKIIPKLKEINSQIRSIILIGKQIQGILKLGQTIIKLILLFVKVFKFVKTFLLKLPLPNQFTTVGISNAFSQATQTAKEETDGFIIALKAINALLGVVVSFIRYLIASINEILKRLEILLANLEVCEAVRNSPVIAELKQTKVDLISLQDQLASYIVNYDLQTSPTTSIFQGFTINVLPEQTATPVTHPRRRGIALDKDGAIVVQSDLTFATNSAIIIAEVQQLLVSRKLAKDPSLIADATNLAIINTSLNFLETNDVSESDLALPVSELDTPDNLNENSGLGLNAFMNNLKGGRKLRIRTRAALDASSANLKSQINTEKTAAANSVNNNSSTSGATNPTPPGSSTTLQKVR